MSPLVQQQLAFAWLVGIAAGNLGFWLTGRKKRLLGYPVQPFGFWLGLFASVLLFPW